MTLYFDTHAHYDDNAFNKDRDEILSSLPQKGVSLTVCPACDMASARACVRLADVYPHVYAAVGVHPPRRGGVPVGWLAGLEALSSTLRWSPSARSVWTITTTAPQERSSRTCSARRWRWLSSGVCRDCPRSGGPSGLSGRGSRLSGRHRRLSLLFRRVEDAKTLVNLGWMLSFTGAVTFKNARRALEVIGWIPMERIMIETDSPYLAPEPFRGRRNDSTYVYRVAEVIAQVKNLPVDEVARITMENGKRFFHIDLSAET